jgi:hypothetical protein
MEPIRSPRQFADVVLSTIRKALESDDALNTLTADVDAIVKRYTEREGRVIVKVQKSTRMVYGWASVVTKDGADVEDLQKDVMDIGNLRETVHTFIREERVGKTMHDGPQTAEVLDSFVFDAEVQKALGVDFGCEGWLVGYYVTDDDVWKRVESGELAAFSIGGDGIRTPLPEKA